ncbi:MAG: hypothetical protein HUJ83_10605 [Veillonella sp.]|nr:hypothetical protein [Veillonella sp.]
MEKKGKNNMKIDVVLKTDNYSELRKAVEELKRIEQECGVNCTLTLLALTRNRYYKESTL